MGVRQHACTVFALRVESLSGTCRRRYIRTEAAAAYDSTEGFGRDGRDGRPLRFRPSASPCRSRYSGRSGASAERHREGGPVAADGLCFRVAEHTPALCLCTRIERTQPKLISGQRIHLMRHFKGLAAYESWLRRCVFHDPAEQKSMNREIVLWKRGSG